MDSDGTSGRLSGRSGVGQAWVGAATGVAAGAVTLGVAELGALVLTRGGMTDGTPSPLVAVASAFIDLTPGWLKDFAVETFGTNDKVALFTGMGLVLALVCAAIGVVGAPTARRPAGRGVVGMLLFVLVGALGLASVLTRAGAGPGDAVPTVVGVLAGLWALRTLWSRLARGIALDGAQAVGSAGAPTTPASPTPARVVPTPGLASRRAVLGYAGGLTVLGAVAVTAGRALSRAAEVVEAARTKIVLPGVRTKATVTVPAGADQGIAGQPPYVTPADDFYRIDTAAVEPVVDPGTWTLRVTGMVDHEVTMTYAELLEQPMVEALVTLACVSNTVGGDLVGNAVWTGWPVRELLARAGVQAGADMVLSTSADGWTAGTPLATLTDDRNALIAVGMNGAPLPVEHGFPVRLVVPGLYGYVSATKWVTELKVTTFEQDMGFWTDKGWSALGPVKTQSRIDVPARGAALTAGQVVIAGVAWAQHTGIAKVEVQVDEGQWQQATLAEEPTVDSWVQWRLPWAAVAGDHTLRVRATDKTGATQPEERSSPAPDGATGWDSVEVQVGSAG